MQCVNEILPEEHMRTRTNKCDMMPLPLTILVDRLTSTFGLPSLPPARSPFELILWENVAYLADDAKRENAYELLRASTGLTAEGIARVDQSRLLAVARHGIVPEQTAVKLRTIAELAMSEFAGDVDGVLKLPSKEAFKALRKFPAIGEPAAEKILMMNGKLAVLALESNGLRVLQRVGYGEDTGKYSRDYKDTREAVADQIPDDREWLTTAHFALRRHGQAVCRRSTPECARCPLVDGCRYFSEAIGSSGSNT